MIKATIGQDTHGGLQSNLFQHLRYVIYSCIQS